MQSSTVSSTQQQGIFSAAPQRAATAQGGRRHLSLPPPCEAAGPTASRFPFRSGHNFRRATCRHPLWRQATRVTWGACRHSTFDNPFTGWSFLTFHPSKWSILSKIRPTVATSEKNYCTRCRIVLPRDFCFLFETDSHKIEITANLWPSTMYRDVPMCSSICK